MTRLGIITTSIIVVTALAGVPPLIGAVQRHPPDGPIKSLMVVVPKDEGECQALGFRHISGEFELAKPVESVAFTVDIYNDGVKASPFPSGWLEPGDERRGRFGVVFVDLDSLPTVLNTNDVPLRLAPRRAFYKDWISMGRGKDMRGSGPVDVDQLIDLGAPLEYHVFDRSAATDDGAPLFAIYAGPAPLNAKGVRSVDELLKRNPKGRIMIGSVRFNDRPTFKLPPQGGQTPVK